MLHTRTWVVAVLAGLTLAACGGGGDDAPPARATIITAQVAGQATAAQIDAGTAASGLQALSGPAACGVEVRYVLYMTRDPHGEPATASAGVLVPSGSSAQCSGERPVLLYAHGTDTNRAKNMADIVNDSEAKLVMAMYAAQGFIVVAPNYLGYDRSSLDYHPYLNAEAQAVDMIDGLRAARAHLAAASTVKPSNKLFISGYSQGGHVAMATHKVLQRDHASEFTVTASGPMAGPYNLGKFGLVINRDLQVNAGAVIFTPMLLTSFQQAYGNVYAKASDMYQAPFDATAPTLFPTTQTLTQIVAAGKLPNDPTFTAKLFGPGGLITETARLDYANNPENGFRKAMERNTLLGWTPTRPMAMCSGANDPTVYIFNQRDAQADFASRNVLVPAFDVEDRATLPAGPAGDLIYGGFQQAKAAAGANAVASYHGGLVPPFCTALVRGFFQQVLASGQ